MEIIFKITSSISFPGVGGGELEGGDLWNERTLWTIRKGGVGEMKKVEGGGKKMGAGGGNGNRQWVGGV